MAKKGRVFVRGMTSETYGLGEFRNQQLAAPRVRDNDVVVDTGDSAAHSGDSAKSRTWWRVGPGDDPFLTQTVQVHFVELPPESSNNGHGHQNEAAFYILEGRGYEIHDDQRYDWKQGDLVFVHTDSVHRHFNPYDEKAVALVMKAKCTWMFLGLIQQGRSGPIERPDEFGDRSRGLGADLDPGRAGPQEGRHPGGLGLGDRRRWAAMRRDERRADDRRTGSSASTCSS